jgi:tellurite resistance protein TerC
VPSLVTAAQASAGENFASFDVAPWQWAAFVTLVAVLLLIDVLVVHRSAHVVTFKEAAIESAVWITIGTSFTLVILAWQGGQAGGEYLAGYLIEKSLSIDNVFVWAVILSYFAVPAQFQFRVLFWGIFGALVLRAVFIFAGVALIESFDFVLYFFGALLLYSAYKIGRHREAEFHPEKSLVLATPLFAVLVMIEATDVVFAVDSIPAILAVSREPFIVFSSNAFAILGLRALYFCLSGMAGRFRYLNVGLAVILAFVGVKMLIAELYHFPTWASLLVIIVVLTVTIVASLRAEKREPVGS